ncbi:MAG: two-component sensor histidine kinase [Bacteroidetes bacterium GWC2_33_15]|nr:MAG: two-component sensor histidine kinase [Bacteroidetes bacterium GWA2_33_15]OFX52655.1 MAG: two-component sensor histidine kinase [Bacteroidetes bacterium GWC2_33_15]OFX64039.1 MAG: two-component sensor histidine kinase [Bacteroidetes bacterium GWB2_32_14]OFX67276.1 MAG: two-component sensor histidine kinase [Bacteroidetes bacterium GWD2_33_33]HAN18865.1 two-component sensor histidine kinase [Bacteroidales bacterium]
MRTYSPRQMAIIIAVISSLIAGIALVVFYYSIATSFILPLIFSLMLIFIVIYILVSYLLTSFIFEKINPIYKTIHNLNIPENDLKKGLEEKDIINEVNKEVETWANNKTSEIAQLKELAKYRKEFLGNVSHELKTPIFNIQGYVLTLLDGGLEDSSINRTYLEKTEKSINRMISIVQDLEDISKLESGELKLNYSNFDIIELVKEVFDDQELRAKEKDIQLKFNLNYDKAVPIYADREQVDRVLTNLIVNSINYGIEKGTTVVSFMDMGENILCEVTDNGVGIPEKELPRVFERFYRVDKSRSRNAGGTGLGLAIVKHIIEAHNQTIHVRSSVNKGTSFVFTLKKEIK